MGENDTKQVDTFISERSWGESYPQLHALAMRLVRQLSVPDWLGQEEDIAWDIVQESMRRAYEYVQKAANGKREPVQSLTALLNTVAQNYCRDLRRREWRLNREMANTPQAFMDNEENFSEVATENAYREHLFYILAHEIAHFPPKQQQALLTDLADRMAFEEKPSTLQAAFQAVGIRLEEYRKPRSEYERERSRNAALLAHAYKRLKTLKKVQNYLYDGGVYSQQEPADLTLSVNMKEQGDMENHQPLRLPQERERNRNVALLAHAYKRLNTPDEVRDNLPNGELAHSRQEPTDLALSVDMQEQGDMENHEPLGPPSVDALLEHKPQTDSYAATAGFIDQLPEHYQLPLRLHCVEKKSYAEIARQLGRSEGTIKSQISRGQKKLQQLLAQGSMQTGTDCEDTREKMSGMFLEEQVAKLPAIYQMPIRLHFLAKKTYTEIASQLNIPKGTVKSYISRGCKLLTQLMEKSGEN